MNNPSIIEVAETMARSARNQSESSDYARGIRETIEELARKCMTQSHKTASRLYQIGENCR